MRIAVTLGSEALGASVPPADIVEAGVGVSHRPVIEGLHGLSYDSPAAHVREYLAVLGPLLREGAVSECRRWGTSSWSATRTRCARRLRRYAEIGVTEFWATVDGDAAAAASVHRTRTLLARLGPELEGR